MSMAIQRSKYTGDPGLFGDIWGGIKGIAKVGLGIAGTLPVVGGVARIARQIAFPGDARMRIPGASTFPTMSVGRPIPQFPTGAPGSGRYLGPAGPTGRWGDCPGGFFNPDTGDCYTPVERPGTLAAIQRILPGGETGMMMPENGAAPMAMRAGKASGWPGYHWNKSDYFLRSGEFVPAGSRAVRNRRRNPANPRATSNAITRIKGAKRYAKSLSAITIRKHHHHSRH